uniref:Uncharacterized protein n=1 Tax=Caulobacter sp. (strain K31) TaxID=366602 RepID=B0SUN6_CAUSK
MLSAIVIMAGFAAVWWIGGGVVGHAPVGMILAGPVFSAALIFAASARLKAAPKPEPAERKRVGRIIGLASGGEGVAILVANILLANLGLSAYFIPALAVIVGLHFLPLAKFLPARIYYATALLLVLVGVAGLAIDAAHRPMATSMMAAIVLWLTCAARLARLEPARASDI